MKVSQDVLRALDAAQTSGNDLRLSGTLDRPTYLAVAKAIEAAGGRWVRKAQAHQFDGPAADAIEPILLTGEVVLAKQEFGAFYTSADLADEVVRRAGIGPGMNVLEPSAGHGAIALAARAAGANVGCVEIRPQAARVLVDLGFNTLLGDFLGQAPVPSYDSVVMNPPFAKRADIHHIYHAAKFLRPGGTLVSIASASVTFREDTLGREFREYVQFYGGSFEVLPSDSFKASGTSVNTCIVTLRAPT